MDKCIVRSPLFYVGDKYRLMRQLLNLFPKRINNFYEPFVGGGTVFLNIQANNYFLNDIDSYLIDIHKFLTSHTGSADVFFRDVENVIYAYGLSRSYKKDIVPSHLKKKFKKTYYAKFNRDGYEKLKMRVNRSKKTEPLLLYILLIYGFNRMLRFNRSGVFNLPVGNVDFNKNVSNALNNYFNLVSDRKITFTSYDFNKFLGNNTYTKDDFVYIDPPYLITASEYNKYWSIERERELFNFIDSLNEKKVRFALSNVTHYNEDRNDSLINWMKKYRVYTIKSNYINYHNNKQKKMKEVLIVNY